MQLMRGRQQWLMEEGGCRPIDHNLLPEMAVMLFEEKMSLIVYKQLYDKLSILSHSSMLLRCVA